MGQLPSWSEVQKSVTLGRLESSGALSSDMLVDSSTACKGLVHAGGNDYAKVIRG